MPNSPDVRQILQLARSPELGRFLKQKELSPQILHELQPEVLSLHRQEPATALRLVQAIYEVTNQTSPDLAALSHWLLGSTLLNDRQYLAAHHHLHEARKIFLRLGQADDAARVGVSCIATLAHCGYVVQASQLSEEIETILTKSVKRHRGDLRHLIHLSINKALVHELMGDPEHALSIHESNLQNVVSVGDAHLLARINMDRARVLVQLHAFDEANSIYAQAEMLLHSIDNKVDLLKLYLDRTSLLIALQRFEEAAKTQALAKKLLIEIGGMDHSANWLTLLQVQLVLARKEKPTIPLVEQLREAQQTFAEQGPLIDECLTWLLLGGCELSHQRLLEAERCYEKVLGKAKSVGEQRLEFRALHGLSQVKRQQGGTEEAILFLQLAIDKLELVRHGLQIETCRVAFLSDYLHFYHDLTRLYLQQKQWERAFEVIERGKSRVVGEKLASRLQFEITDATQSTDADVRQLAQELQTALQQLQQINQAIRIRQANDLTRSLPTDEESASLTTLEHLIHTLTMQMQYQQPRFSLLTNGRSVSLERLQELLYDVNFVQYFVNHQNYCALLIDTRGINHHIELAQVQQVAHVHKALTAAIERMLMLSAQLDADRLLQRLPTLVRDVNHHLFELWKMLFFPLQACLPTSGRLILSLDGALHALPFHAFFDGDKYIMERYAINYIPSATVLDYCMQDANQGHGTLLCGFDDGRLKAVQKELHSLVHLFPRAIMTLDTKSTAATFLTCAPQQQIIHLAAHASFRRDRPMLSSISFADRHLTLVEIANLNLCADLVGLSGCETGAGEYLGGDLLSLTTGFLGAGARSLLVSLWRVEDESTARLVESFYQAMLQGFCLSEALHLAQQTMLQNARYANDITSIFQHPAFWAPFIVIGHGMKSVKLEHLILN